MLPTHTHLTEYADPVLRPPSPASSVGTAYPPDQTSFSDSEFQLSGSAFDRKCLDRIGLHLPRQDERDAEKDPLITVQGPGGRTYWVGETPLDPTAAKSSCILRVLVLCTDALISRHQRRRHNASKSGSGTFARRRDLREDPPTRLKGGARTISFNEGYRRDNADHDEP